MEHEKISEYEERLKEYKHELKTDKTLDCVDYNSLECEIKNYIIKIANLKGMKGLKDYWSLEGFQREIVDLIFDADKKNLEKLRKAYPELVNICRGVSKK